MDRRLLVLALSMFSLGTGGFIVAGVLPQISNTYGVTVGAAGQMTTAFALTYAVLAPLVTAAAASVPRKRLLLSGLAIFVLANIATALAPTYELALITRAVAGLGAAMFAPTATGAAPMLVAPERRGYALSVAVAGLTSSTALGSPMGAIIGSFVDWRWAKFAPFLDVPLFTKAVDRFAEMVVGGNHRCLLLLPPQDGPPIPPPAGDPAAPAPVAGEPAPVIPVIPGPPPGQ